jgi:hypothetical protein
MKSFSESLSYTFLGKRTTGWCVPMASARCHESLLPRMA